MYFIQKSNAKSSSRRQLAIEGVQDGILLLPGHRYRRVLSVSSVNFELKSEAEQDALIETYQSFLNSLGSSIQILVRTREMDMAAYVSDIQQRLHGETEEVYRLQLEEYCRFIQSLVNNNKILSRKFYVIVKFDSDAAVDFTIVKDQLAQLVDIVSKGLARLGMQSQPLNSLAVLNLFYSFYNEPLAKRQPLIEEALDYLHSMYVTNEANA